MLDRGSFSQCLWENLKDRDARVHTGKRLTCIVPHADGVTVAFADGTSAEGSIVIGADGIWSSVREQMRELSPDGLFSTNPFTATYRGIFGRGPLQPGFKPGQLFHAHGRDRNLQVFASEKESQFITYERIETTNQRVDFTDKGADEQAAPWLNMPLPGGSVFGDIWKHRAAAGVANFDEGSIVQWHSDRVVLVGDSVHKVRTAFPA